MLKEVHFSYDDYKWVKKTIRKHPRGLSVKDIVKISKDQRNLKEKIWYEKPPGREKIYSIVKKYAGIDWDYKISKGGRTESVVKIKKIDTTTVLNLAVRDMLILKTIDWLQELYDKKEIKYDLYQMIELFNIKETIFYYPAEILYSYDKQKKEQEIQFTRALDITKTAIKKIKKIELIQMKINNKFEKTFECLEEIKNSPLLQAEIFGNKSNYKSFKIPRNTIREIHKINV